MRAVNNTLREIILRERPLTVTNNDPRPVPALGPSRAAAYRVFFQQYNSRIRELTHIQTRYTMYTGVLSAGPQTRGVYIPNLHCRDSPLSSQVAHTESIGHHYCRGLTATVTTAVQCPYTRAISIIVHREICFFLVFLFLLFSFHSFFFLEIYFFSIELAHPCL